MSEVVNLMAVPDYEETEILARQPADRLSIGQQLLIARMQHNFTIEQVAKQLKWSAHQIAEIEAGNYAVFPDPASVRGFVRTYAKILKLDVAPLLNELSVEFAKHPVRTLDRPLLDTPFNIEHKPWLGQQNKHSRRIVGGILLVLLCLIVTFMFKIEIGNFIRDLETRKVSAKSSISAVAKSGILADLSSPNAALLKGASANDGPKQSARH
ncbi:MAG: helix-turn-helix protein [Solimicrobium sp.]|jgi:cytoskeleton protein RodZ|nr:helix-turn-helix protein [Solimicrobium sp.]